MASIIIREEDNTSSVVSLDTYDIAYVPGFGDVSIPNVSAFKPQLVATIEQFRSLFGSTAPVYSESYYDGTTAPEGWDVTVNGDFEEFDAGNIEMGYLYAQELLLQGLPIYFERINELVEETKPVSGSKITFTLVQDTVNTYEATVTIPTFTKTWDSVQYNMVPVVELDDGVTYTSASYANVTGSTTQCKITLTGVVLPSEVNDVQGNVSLTKTGSSPITAEAMYEAMKQEGSGDSITKYSIFEKLKDRGTYSIKYVTTGGYPVLEFDDESVTKILLDVTGAVESSDAGEITGRGEAIVLLDHTNNYTRALIGSGSLFEYLNADASDTSSFRNKLQTTQKDYSKLLSFAACFTPWCEYSLSAIEHAMPASFAYMKCLAVSTRTYGSQYAVSGVARGLVKDITNVLTNDILTNNIANTYQKDPESGVGISINAITMIQPYGFAIWGNRTMYDIETSKGATATSYLNLRSMVCTIKKIIYTAARRYMFEQNSDILWCNFRSMITPELDRLQSGEGISKYTIMKGANSGKTKLYCNITIWPVYAVEKFDVTIQLEDEDASIIVGE